MDKITTHVMLLNSLQYENNKGRGTRIGFIIVDKDKISNDLKFVGCPELSGYYSYELFDNIPFDAFLKPLEATITAKRDFKNPMKVRNVLSSIKYGNDTIDLL